MATAPTLWKNPLGYRADVHDLPEKTTAGTGNVSWESLFPALTQVPLEAGGVAPSREDFNSLFYLLGASIYWLQRGRRFVWTAEESYLKGDMVTYGTDGTVYICLQDHTAATSTAPGTAGGAPYWQDYELFIRGICDIDAILQRIAKDENDYVTHTQAKLYTVLNQRGTVVNLSGTVINGAQGSTFKKTITANTAFTFSGLAGDQLVALILVNGGSKTVTWPAAVKWPDGVKPTLSASGVDIITFFSPDGGTTIYGFPAFNFK